MPARFESCQPRVSGRDWVPYIPSTSSLMEPNDGRRRLLDLDPSGVSHDEGEDSRSGE